MIDHDKVRREQLRTARQINVVLLLMVILTVGAILI